MTEKMKLRNILILTAAVTGSALSSCDYTDLSPLDSFTDESFWTTPNDLKLYANGLYGIMSSPTATGDKQSDNFVANSYDGYLFNEYTVPASASSGNGWYWNDIRSCNSHSSFRFSCYLSSVCLIVLKRF